MIYYIKNTFGQTVAICKSEPMFTLHHISALLGKYKKIYVILVYEACMQSDPKRGSLSRELCLPFVLGL